MPFTAYLSFLRQSLESVEHWEKRWPEYTRDPSLRVPSEVLEPVLAEFYHRLEDNYPFVNPVYAGQMLKPPHPVAMLAYWTTMLINPNNHALDGGPATAQMEKDCINEFLAMFGWPDGLGHLTSSGTIANMEALWVARQLHPDKPVVFCDQAHYTHKRMCEVLKIPYIEIPAAPGGRMDIKTLKELLDSETVGTVVATLGTTSLGVLDPLDAIVKLKRQYDFRIHVDAAYGGYFTLLKDDDPGLAAFYAIEQCDSLVVDPHKHGMQPYGCGCVLFKDVSVGTLYRHDSPYTYFTSDDLHLGEISLECSRAGASAAALWMTIRCLPLAKDKGFGPILKKTRQAAQRFSVSVRQSDNYVLHQSPELDIVTFFPKAYKTSEISEKTHAVFKAGMASKNHPLFLAKLKLDSKTFVKLHPELEVDTDEVVILRSCMMKPEHLAWCNRLFEHLEALAESEIKV